jgi:hypothetical protein
VQFARLLSFCGLFVLAGAASSCGTQAADPQRPGDPVSNNGVPPPAGKERRIHEIADPASPLKAPHKTTVAVSGVVVVHVDTYDETHNGRSAGTIYVADLGSDKPYSGLSLFNPSFIPGNLRVGAGDALDLRGEFQENQDLPVKFAPGAFLVQLAGPIGTFRFDAKVPDPIDIDVNDLTDYAKGRKWMNMLVRVKNVTLQRDAFGETTSGRISSDLLPSTTTGSTPCEAPFPKIPTLVNELMDLQPLQLKKDETIKTLVGVVTYFCNIHIAPRSAADIVR